ncbi:hypothetical protein JW805_15025 [Roseomonas aeriglobus]|nr:hypothetical protein [Roseomonas aeriglobus]
MSNLDPLPFVDDRLPDAFALDRSESEWLLTLLSADELRYIFEGPDEGEPVVGVQPSPAPASPAVVATAQV